MCVNNVMQTKLCEGLVCFALHETKMAHMQIAIKFMQDLVVQKERKYK